MPIFDAHLGITKVDEIPVECVGCGTQAVLRDLTHASKQHLVDATYRVEFSGNWLYSNEQRRFSPVTRFPITPPSWPRKPPFPRFPKS